MEYLVLILSAVLLLWYALSNNKEDNVSEYVVAKRNIGVFALTATLVMTELNTATMVSFSSLGYISGFKALALPAVFFIGLIFYALVVAKKWKNFDGTSVVDFFIKRYDRRIGAMTAVFLLLAMAGFSASYLKSLVLLFENIVPSNSYWLTSAYLVIAILFTMIKKGLVSIIRVDVFSFIVMAILMPFVLYRIYTIDFDVSSEITFHPELLKGGFITSLIPLTMFSYILAPWYGQRIFAAKSKRVAYVSVLLSSVLVFILYAFSVVASCILAKKGIDFSEPQRAFPFAIDYAMPDELYFIGYIILFLISSTTLTGVWSAMANIGTEFLPGKVTQKHNMIMLIGFSLVTYVLANTLVDNILNKMILANIPVVALSFALLAGFYWQGVSKAGVYVSVIIGILFGSISYLVFGEQNYTYYWAFAGIPSIFIGGYVASLLFPDLTKSAGKLKTMHPATSSMV